MASNTPNLGLLKKDPATDGNDTFNIKTMLNDNWDKIDEAVKDVQDGLADIKVPDASLTQKGIVQLSNATDGTRENVAATEKAVKAAYDQGKAAQDNLTTHLASTTHKQVSGVIQSGSLSNAEGYQTEASGSNSHAEGGNTIASGSRSHAEGGYTKATNADSHAEGYYTVASGDTSHAEGYYTVASGGTSHAEGYKTSAISNNSHAEGHGTKVNETGTLASVPINNTDLIGSSLIAVYGGHAEGFDTLVLGQAAHAEGVSTKASGQASHAEGQNTKASGYASHAEGNNTTASDYASHAEGSNTIASGDTSHAEGDTTTASGSASHAEGTFTIASGSRSHAEGYRTIASGEASHAEGSETDTNGYALSHIMGEYGNAKEAGSWHLANGSYYARGLAARISSRGGMYSSGSYSSSGADYAEMFEWLDQNQDNEDRVGYFVTLDGENIRKATSKDDYILGIVSANPSVIGDNHDLNWKGRFLTDDWGRTRYGLVDIPAITETRIIINEENGIESEETIEIKPAKQEWQPLVNPEWNPDEYYTRREKRPEWNAVGMMGKLLVRDDGTCKVNGYCQSNDDGIATASDRGYRVMERVAENIIRVVIK
ncbi:exosporium leader peptide [Paenibacillus donghaensis]|uniref:peptidase G2 autoproteolytic cleavage domain-containing protein n=1 Tax=Paenibacillus donghaensis TaxID=414771 RepID=UPI001883D543|nr:peptidase G2 autoproteolytic cleavage domain-containing protein [Paenibacillus donghaensis]MBE9913387.1 exosporium leader peptide [Paenibacillus donghaensis]